MDFFVKATNSGKTIQVIDKIQNKEVFNEYIDLDGAKKVSVGSPNGQTGKVDIRYALNGPANTTFKLDYEVRTEEIVEVDPS
jgi:hypothetical protein